MINLKINGLNVSVEKGTTLLEAAEFLGFPIPTLCHMDGLSPYGACRLCVVEIGERLVRVRIQNWFPHVPIRLKKD
jgi:NADH dehydrogenase/NADH:ubiquinone oxidoreductase subunit G